MKSVDYYFKVNKELQSNNDEFNSYRKEKNPKGKNRFDDLSSLIFGCVEIENLNYAD